MRSVDHRFALSNRLAERAFQRLALQRPLSDLRMKRRQINRRRVGLGPAVSENTPRAFQKLVLPLRDLIRVDIELLRQFGQRLLPSIAARATFALKAGAWFRRVRFVI